LRQRVVQLPEHRRAADEAVRTRELATVVQRLRERNALADGRGKAGDRLLDDAHERGPIAGACVLPVEQRPRLDVVVARFGVDHEDPCAVVAQPCRAQLPLTGPRRRIVARVPGEQGAAPANALGHAIVDRREGLDAGPVQEHGNAGLLERSGQRGNGVEVPARIA
jgi:hypothetical protein